MAILLGFALLIAIITIVILLKIFPDDRETKVWTMYVGGVKILPHSSQLL